MSYFNKKGLYSWLILLLAGLLIFWQLGQIPAKLAFDELEFARLALSLDKKWQVFSPLATGHATFYFYLLLLSIKTFGLNILALRIPAAILAVINSYLVLKLLKFYFPKGIIAFLGAVVFSTSHWVLNFGRYGFEATYLLFFELSSLLAILQFQKTQKLRFFWLGLITTIATFYSYLPGRIFVILPLLMLINAKVKPRLIITFILAFGLFSLPLIKSSGTFENRVQELSYLNQDLAISTKVNYFAKNLLTNISMLNFQGDLNGRHNYPGKPGLNPILGILFWLGLFLSLKRAKANWLFYVWAFLSIVPSLFTLPQENPHFLRTYTLTVSLVFFITYAINSLIKYKPKWLILLVMVLIVSSLYEVRTYFYYQNQVFKQAFEKTQKDLDRLQLKHNFQK